MSKKWKVAIWIVVGLLIAGYLIAMVFAVSSAIGGGSGGSDKIAVIKISGIMSSSGLSGGLFGESGTTAEKVVGDLKKAEEDPDVKSIILRIDSPGGTASSGQEIYSQVKRTRKSKPVVASIADVGASAAYWAASSTDEIIAGPASDVGSIGVIISVPNYKGLMDKLGISFVTITQGKYKSIGDPARPMTEEEKQILRGQSEVIYRRFISDVATGRRMKVPEVEKLADGLAWPGSQAIEMKLVDRLGNWQDAVDRAAKLGKIEGKPEIISYDEPSPFEVLRSLFGGKSPRLLDILSSEVGRQPLSR